jgi:uncharacterized protein
MVNDLCWFELVTPVTEAAGAFYKAVVGWTDEMSSGPNGPYTIFKAGEHPVGGMLRMADMPPAWLAYVAVDDVDAHAGKVKAAGGQIHQPPLDIPQVGRFAVVADPQGAAFILFRASVDQAPPRPAPMAPGSLGWAELHAADGEAVFPFYADLFGWVRHDAIPMGEMGVYQTFGSPQEAFGGMMTGHQPAPRPYWLLYFGVEDIDAAQARVEANGGRMLMGPTEVPGGAFVLNAMDPQGGLFALLGPKL